MKERTSLDAADGYRALADLIETYDLLPLLQYQCVIGREMWFVGSEEKLLEVARRLNKTPRGPDIWSDHRIIHTEYVDILWIPDEKGENK